MSHIIQTIGVYGGILAFFIVGFIELLSGMDPLIVAIRSISAFFIIWLVHLFLGMVWRSVISSNLTRVNADN